MEMIQESFLIKILNKTFTEKINKLNISQNFNFLFVRWTDNCGYIKKFKVVKEKDYISTRGVLWEEIFEYKNEKFAILLLDL